MKKFIINSVFIVLGLAPWACNRQYPLAPAPAFTPTFTLTPTSTFTALPTKTSTPTSTPTATATSVCQPVHTTPVIVGPVNQEMGGTTALYQSLAQWQVGGLPAPPVDFSTQMVILIVPPSCNNPVSSVAVTGICEDSNQITISGIKSPYCGSVCSYYMSGQTTMAYGIALPQSNLPVVWNITNVACGQQTPVVWYATPVPSFVPVFATPIP